MHWAPGGGEGGERGGLGDSLHLGRWERGVDSKVKVKCTVGGGRVAGQTTGDAPGAGAHPASQNQAEGSHQKGGLRGTHCAESFL